MQTITQADWIAQQARQRIERRQAMVATSNALLMPRRRRDVICTALGLALVASGFALFVVAVILNSTYWAAAGGTPLHSWLLMAAGVVIEVVNFVGPTAISRLRGFRRLAAGGVWLVMLGMVVLAAAGFVSMNVGDSIAARAVAIDHARAANDQRSQAVAIAQLAVETDRTARDAECRDRGPRCRLWETNLSAALAELQQVIAMPLATAPLASPDPLATAAAEFGIPASTLGRLRLGGLVFVFSLASGLLLWWGAAIGRG